MRLLVVVDAQNLYGAIRERWGKNARADYLQLKRLSKGKNNYASVEYRAYIGGVRSETASSFARVLKVLGYKVYSLSAKLPGTTNWDSGIIVDVLKSMPDFDHLTLVTGDGDFLPLVERLKESGKKVRLVTVPFSSNPRLASSCDEVVLFEEKHLLRR